MADPPPEYDPGEGFCYLAGCDRIYFNKEQEIIRVDCETDGIIEFVTGVELSEEEITGFDTTIVLTPARIPARYIAGYVYDQSSNVFDFHAWVEVYADETGWRAMDPTFGQFDFVDPTHIGFADNETDLAVTGDLRPGVIKILDYTPREAGPIPPTPLALSSLKICGKELRYGIFVNGKKEGEYTAHLHQANGYFCLREFVDLPPRNTEMRSELLMDEHGFVIEYVNTGLLNYLPMSFRFSFTEEVLKFNTAVGEQKAEGEMARIFKDEVQVDLLKLVQWELLAARLVAEVEEVEEVEEETVKTVTVFTGDTPGYFNLTATISPCGVVYGGSLVDGWFCAISGAQYKTELYLTGDGVLTRLEIPEVEMKAVLVAP